MKIFFNNTQISGDNIINLSQSSKLFNSQFKLGATLCRQIQLDVLKSAVASQPTVVYIKDDNNNTLFHLYVDSCDETNLDYYSYTLLDGMVKFNAPYDYSVIGVTKTVQNILNAMCLSVLGTTAPTVTYMGDLIIDWDNNTIGRDFISYIAEVNGCFARINASNQLEFVELNRQSQATVSVSTCKDIVVGQHFLFDRVVYDPGTAVAKYPDDEHYVGTGNTYYVNTDNFLFTDSQTYTRAAIVQHIYSKINRFEFYNIKTSRCQLPDVKAGDVISFSMPTECNAITQDNKYLITQNNEKIQFLAGDTFSTIAQFEWDYNFGWIGGFELDVNSQQQEETQVTSASQAVKSIKIKVDRELGQIEQRVSDNEDNITQIIQDATGITGTFSNYKGVKYITADINGITISSSDTSSPTELNLDNDGVFINDAQGNEVAAMEADTFRTSEWLMTQTKDNTVFNIFRRRD